MTSIAATRMHGHALLAGAADARVINQRGADTAAAVTSPVINTSLILNTAPNGIAVDLEQNGVVVNSGTIGATGPGGVGVRIVSQAAAGSGAVVINTGTIGGKLDGIDLPAGGRVANAAGGLIEGGRYGIDVSGGPGTIADAGTIEGGTDAIAFSGSFADRVILERGAVLHGKVVGGTGTNTLELAAGGTGTLSAFTGEFVNFGTLTVDRSASWTLARGASVGPGVQVTDAGTLTNLGTIASTVTVATGGILNNAGAIIGSTGIAVTATPKATGGDGGIGVSLLSSGVVANSGSITGGTGGAALGAGAYSKGFGGAGGLGISGLSGDVVRNSGVVIGGTGGTGTGTYGSSTGFEDGRNGYGGAGGVGVALQTQSSLTNSGTIIGGAGGLGVGNFYGRGGNGGTGVTLQAGDTLSNVGTISGGAGAVGQGNNYGGGGSGGVGIVLDGSGTLTNGGVVRAGTSSGGSAFEYTAGGPGSAGIVLDAGGLVINTGTVLGSAGVATFGGAPNRGGAGIIVKGVGTVDNSGTILGAAGGEGFINNFYGGIGAAGIVLAGNGLVDNAAGGLIIGAGGQNSLSNGSAGADGIDATSSVTIMNLGTIQGGATPSGDYDGGSGVASSYGTITNAGTIRGGDGGGGGTGITLDGLITNLAGGLIEGGSAISFLRSAYGVQLQGGTVVNSGTILAGASAFQSFYTTGGNGVLVDPGATLINAGFVAGASGTELSSGQTASAGAGVAVGASGVVVNRAGGVIIGGGNGVGIAAQGAVTIMNGGTISGGTADLAPGAHADAITFSGSYADRVILDPGAVLNGKVVGGSGTNTLELAAASGVTGTVSSFGTEFQGFGTITLDKGAHWLLDGASPSGQSVTLAGGSHVLSLNDTAAFSDPITGFSNTDALDLRDVAFAAGAKATLSGSTLTVSSATTTDTLTLLGLKSGTIFTVGNDGAGHVLIDETVSPTAGHNGTAAMRFLAGTVPTLPHAVFSTEAVMADSLHGFMRSGAASATWSANAVGVAHAIALHAVSASATQLAGFDQGSRDSAHPTLLHHAS